MESLDLEVETFPDVGTFVQVSWQTSQPGYSWVEYGLDGALDRSSPTSSRADTRHSVTLYGIPALSDVHIEAFTDLGGRILSGSANIATGNSPSFVPGIEISTYDPDQVYPHPYLLASLQGVTNMLLGMSREGELLWYRLLDTDQISYDIEPAQVGAGVMFNVASWPVNTGTSWIMQENLLGTEHLEVTFSGAHHDFDQLPDGSLAVLQALFGDWRDPATGVDEPVVGDGILEVGAAGVSDQVFDIFDWLEPSPNEYWDQSFYENAADWSHANSLNYYPETDTYLMSFAHLDTVAEIERSTGEVLRSFGSVGDYGFAADSVPIRYQHSAQWTDSGTLIMTVHYDDESSTMAVEYQVDDQARTLTEIWSHGYGEGIVALAEGQVIRLPNGNTLVNFGYAGRLREVTPAGEVVWEAVTDVGSWFGNIMFVDSFYDLE